MIRLTNIKTLVQFLIAAAATLGVRRALTALPKCWLNGLRECLRISQWNNRYSEPLRVILMGFLKP